jgi:F0F1-type ATP synthase membrane subunit c/vacuolar-type H+-ATPase subunit K
MKLRRIRVVVFLVLGAVLTAFSTVTVRAQIATGSAVKEVEGAATLGIARIVYTQEQDLKDGSVMSSSDHGAILSNIPYDSQVLGVVARDAAIIINNISSTESGIPLVSNGEVYILVTTKEGVIKRGDLLTSSTTPGVAVKANRSGYVLGTAKEDDNNTDTSAIDKIVVDLNLHYFNSKSPFPGSLSDIFKIALLPTKEGPTALFKYIVAAAVVLSSIVLGFMTFGRTAAKGVEALGRNPAASRIIYIGIIFNISVVVLIVLAGLTVAFLILRL